MRIFYLSTVGALIILFLYSCTTTAKEFYYSYKVEIYTVDSDKHLITSSSLISYGDYLFEFKERKNIQAVIHGSNSLVSNSSDTIGVYLLSTINKLYYEFDTFAVKNKIVKIGKLAEKPSGLNFGSLINNSFSDVYFTTPKKILINNINCFITETRFVNNKQKDSLKQQLILIRNKRFNSLYKVNGIKFPDTGFCIVGFNIYDLNRNESIVQEIVSMKPLNEREKGICANMVTTAQKCVVDTIKGF